MTRDVKELGLPSPEERRGLREAAGLTHEQVAAAVGVAPGTVRSWESGRTDPRGRKRTLYAQLLLDLGAPPPDAEEATAEAEPGGAAEATAPDGPEEAAPTAAAREDGAVRGPSLRATGAVRASAGGGQNRPAGSGTRPVPPAKRAAKPNAALPRHEAKTPALTGAGPGPGTGSGSGTGPASGPGPGPGSGGHGPGGSLTTAGATATGPDHTSAGPPSTGPNRTPAGPPDTPDTPDTPAAEACAHPPEPIAEPSAEPTAEQPPEPTPEPAAPTAAATPAAAAFDALYGHAAAGLARQAYLLTGRRALAHEAVERAFQQAWAQWPAVATDPDPVGWVRAATYEYALSPWRRLRRAHRSTEKPGKSPVEPADRILLDAVLALAPAHRRTVLLYDGVGLDLPETAAETEASTPTAAHRLLHAHDALADLIPELVDVPPEEQSALLHERFGTLEPAVRLEPRPAAQVRLAGEHRARRWTRAVLGLTAVIAVATTYTVTTAPREYRPPYAPGASVSGVPPHSGPQRLTERSRQLHDKLRSDPAAGPARLVPRSE
ncbi:helix-turn-helix domain-containing protein [Streptomyces sp. NBC_01408]|uniref:helix-turn-helix domain-containing protein n=1 Tax=Streptomyces sp. NBC_01408 TaxID=2903855 RepID=UPI0022512A9E|nr:helix-turn-helix domain-containing protein [Streptomyces sp. NBC_01408]MCX4691466.1 helix-turn-helix domain-containing protein [Streptomyces sp. NBC_01408]